MTANQLALVAPALAAGGIWPDAATDHRSNRAKVAWLIPSVGYSEQLVQRAGRYLQEACFVSLFDPQYSAAARSMAQKYSDLYGQPPSPFAAYGYDAVLLVGQAIQRGASNRSALRSILATLGTSAPEVLDRTVNPFSGFDAHGEAMGSPAVFCLHGNAQDFSR